ncbi:MAG: response regulator [Chitinispirillales bacterium]|nr:response regulator [Chitinispirillales bacterium]
MRDITDITKAQDEITNQNMRINLLLKGMDAALWDMIIDPDDPVAGGNKVWYSDDFRRMLGFTNENDFPNIFSSWSGRLHPEDKERVVNAFAAHINDCTGKTPYDLEHRLMMKNGEYRWFHAFGDTLRNADGVALRVAGAAEDIHERKRQELQIAEMNMNLTLMLDSIPVGIRIVRLDDGKLVYANKAFMDIFGCEDFERDVAGRTAFDFMSEVQPNGRKTVDMAAELFTSENPVMDFECFKLNGEGFTARISSCNINYMGKLSSLAVIENITDKKRLEERLLSETKKNEALAHWYKSVIDAVPMPIAVMDSDMILKFLNETAINFLKREREDLIGRHCSILDAPLCNTPDCSVVCLKRGVRQTTFEQNGRSVIANGAVLKDLHSKTDGFVEVLQDITDIEQLRRSSHKRALVVDALNRAMEVFVSFNGSSFEEVLSSGLQMIADVMGLDRVCFFRQMEVSGETGLKMILQWDKAVSAVLAAYEFIMPTDYPFVNEWIKITKNGGTINCRVCDLPREASDFLSASGVKNIFIAPIIMQGEYWGMISLQDHGSGEYFEDGSFEADLMHMTVRLLAKTLIRFEMEREIINQNEFNRRLFDTAPFCLVTYDEEMNCTNCNDKAVELFGASKDWIINNFFTLMPEYQPDGNLSYDIFINNTKRVFNGERLVIEWMHQTADRQPIPAEVTLARTKQDEKYIGLAFIYDLRSVKEAQRTINEKSELNDILFNNAPVGLTIFDENFKYIDCNEAVLKMYGGITREVYSSFFGSPAHSPEYQPDGSKSSEKAVELVRRVMSGETMRLEWVHQTPEGKPLPIELTLVRAKQGGRYIGLGYIYDMREQVRLKAEIKRQNHLFQTVNQVAELMLQTDTQYFEINLLNAMGIIAKTISADRVCIWKNHIRNGQLYCSQIHEWPKAAQPQKNNDYAVEALYNDIIPGWEETLSHGRYISGLVSEMPDTVKSALIQRGIISILVVPVFVNNEFWGFVDFDDCHKARSFSKSEKVILHSASQLFVNAVIRNDETQKALIASRAKSEFLSRMSHEMRTPMNAIMGMTQVAKISSNLNKTLGYLNKIDESSHELMKLIDDVLDITKIEYDTFKLEPVNFSFNAMIRDILHMTSYNAADKKQLFTYDISPLIPMSLTGDEKRLKQVIISFLINAVKFTPENGKIHFAVSVLEERGGDITLQFEVSDTGIGIPVGKQKNIFVLFEQIDGGLSRNHGGIGLGLALSKRIIEMMDGEIHVESQPQKGSKFTFTCKLKVKSSGKLAKGAFSETAFSFTSADAVDDTPPNLTGKCILIADDIAANRVLLRSMLSSTGARIIDVENGAEAVRVWNEASEDIDLILMDIMMPEMDGYEAVRKIRASGLPRAAYVPIFALTALTNDIDMAAAEKAGMNLHIGKPFKERILYASLRRFLSQNDTPESAASQEKTIFIVDDCDTNLLTAENALQDHYNVLTMSCAASMFKLLNHRMPDLILLDIDMPEIDGFEAINFLKTNAAYAGIPVIFLTGKNEMAIEESAFEMGAVDLIHKPFHASVLLKRIKSHLDIEEVILNRTKLAAKQTKLANERNEKLKNLQNGMVSVLAKMVESRDLMTGQHVERTTKYIKILTESMLELGVYKEEMKDWKIESIVSSARLHDIGKVAIPDSLLNKPGKLTNEEFEIMKSHAAEGEIIIESIIETSGGGSFLNNAKFFAGSHHERWDGSGYPAGLKGEEIPLQGRVMAIADVYDALVSERPYKKAFTHEKAVEIITEESGKHFDPKIVGVFSKISGLFKEVSACQ